MNTAAKIKSNAAWRTKNRKIINESNRIRREKLRQEALDQYGRSCARCGFDNELALHIDHIDDNGAASRTELTGNRQLGGWNYYRELKKLGWPSGYQTLCANCNTIKQQLKLRNSSMA